MNQDYIRQNYDEEEIDLKILMYKALCHWRKALIVGIVIACIMMAWSGYKTISQQKSENDKVLDSLEVLNTEIENLEHQKEEQEEYNEVSVLMKIDPENKWVGNRVYYIGIEDNSDEKDQKECDTLLAAYSSYISGNDIYAALQKQLKFDQIAYVKEVISCSVDATGKTINICVAGDSSANVKKYLDAVEKVLLEKSEFTNNVIAQHNLVEISDVVYSEKNDELQNKQKNNTDLVETIETSISAITTKIENASGNNLSATSVIKSGIKKAVIGFVVGIILVCGYYAVEYMLTSKFYEERLVICGCNYVLGHISDQKQDKKIPAFDQWLMRIFGIETEAMGFDVSCRLIGSNINNLLEDKNSKVALIGAADADTAGRIATEISKSGKADYLGNILADPEALAALSEYANVCIIGCEGTNSINEVSRQFEILYKLNKNILGAIVVK